MKRHNFHMVESSPGPILTSFSLFFTALGGVMYMHFLKQGLTVSLWLSLGFVILTMNLWFLFREGIFFKEYSQKIMLAIRIFSKKYIRKKYEQYNNN